MATIKNRNNNKFDKDVGEKIPSYNVGGSINHIQPLWKIVWRLLKKKINTELPYEPAIPVLGICPKECQSV
jgi:hypothetical protein